MGEEGRLVQLNAHSGFLQSLESVTEYSAFDSHGDGITHFDRHDPESIKKRTLDWAAHKVLQDYNDEAPRQLSFRDITR